MEQKFIFETIEELEVSSEAGDKDEGQSKEVRVGGDEVVNLESGAGVQIEDSMQAKEVEESEPFHKGREQGASVPLDQQRTDEEEKVSNSGGHHSSEAKPSLVLD